MMNLIALSLIATSFVVSGLFSPNPVTNGNNKGDQVIVKDGHRAVAVEYADAVGDGNTKVLISPPREGGYVVDSGERQVPVEVEEGLSRAAASVAGVAQDVKGKAKEAPHGGPRELICDAYGRCKHKVAGVFGTAKGKAVEAEETVEDAVGVVKDLASSAAGMVEEKVEDAKDKVRDVGETAQETTGRVKEKAGEKVREAGDTARGTAERVKEKTGEKVREAGETVREAGEKAKETGERVKGKTEELVEETKEKGRKGKNELSDIVQRGKEVIKAALGYVFGADSIWSLMNLLGTAMAYGIGVWVTFVMSYVLAGVLPRQQFGMVQSKMFPAYFKAMVGSIGMALLGHLLGHRGQMFKSKAEILQGYNLMTSLLMVLANLLFLEPRATKVMFGKMKLEKEEGRGIDGRSTPARVIDTVETDSLGAIPTTTAAAHTTVETSSHAARSGQDAVKSKLAKLDDRLKKLNSYSSLLNVMTLAGLTWHLVYLSQRLSATT